MWRLSARIRDIHQFFLSVVLLFGILPVAIAQESQNIPLFLGSGVRVEYHPNDLPEYALYAPETSEFCAPENMGNSCGRVWWNSRQQAVLGTRYITQVPAMVRLRGPGKDVWWIPSVHCIVADADRKQQSTSSPGVSCVTMLKRPEDRMEWAIGGVAEGMDPAVPGVYTGMIPLVVTGDGTRWELDVPIVYTVHEGHDSSCTTPFFSMNPQGGWNAEVDFGSIEEGSLGTREVTVKLGVAAVKNAKWRVQVQIPEEPNNPFALSVTPTQHSGAGMFKGGYISYEPLEFTFTGEFSKLERGNYTRDWTMIISCIP